MRPRQHSSVSYSSVEESRWKCGPCRKRKTREYYPDEKMDCWKKTLIIIAIVLFCLILLGLILMFVVFPIIFKNSISLQRFFVFMNIDNPQNPEFDHPEKYDMEGVVNFYHVTNDYDTNFKEQVKIGMWLVKPEDEINSTETDVATILKQTKHPVLFYLHGVACNRILPQVGYKKLRKRFLMIGIDYRGFGDSSDTPLTELGIIHDNVQIYQWVKNKTTQDIYVWGHSLGTAISTHTVKALKEYYNIVPMGLVLESPFTSMREEVINHPLGKLFSWLPYFYATILDPIADNGFLFETVKNILSVDCPIMIMIAEDDNVIPYFLGRKVAEVATYERNLNYQGNVTYHQFGKLGYKHNDCITDMHIDQYVKEFVDICEDFKARQPKQV